MDEVSDEEDLAGAQTDSVEGTADEDPGFAATLSGREAPTTASSTSRDTPDLFVSYRVTPDEPLARALKQLLESAYDPTPNVFVSGIGGIRASSRGFREQIHHAATQASAFLAIITPQSKDRDWVLFEAGAAFGRDIPYVPVVFDVPFSDLSSTIGGYQGVAYKDRDRMEQVLHNLAPHIDCAVRPRFGSRFAPFTKTFDKLKIERISEDGSVGSHRLNVAIQLAMDGETKLAEEEFNKCVDEAGDDLEDKCHCVMARQVFVASEDGTLDPDFLYRMDEDLKATATWAYWASGEESRPLQKQRLLDRTISGGVGAVSSSWFVTALARTIQASPHDLSRARIATEKLIGCIRSDVPWVRAEAANELVSLPTGIEDRAKIACISTALQRGKGELYNRLGRIAEDLDWDHVAVYAYSRAVESERGGYFNRFGALLSSLECPSLAYHWYEKASELGTTVAFVNMANLLRHGSNDYAALEVLQKATTFDAADPGYPYETRANLERKIRGEKKRLKMLVAEGREVLQAVATLSGLALESPGLAAEQQDEGAVLRSLSNEGAIEIVEASRDSLRLRHSHDGKCAELDLTRSAPFELYCHSSEGIEWWAGKGSEAGWHVLRFGVAIEESNVCWWSTSLQK